MNQNKTSSDMKLKGRDFINLGIFTVIFIVLFMACIMVMSMTAYTQPFGCALGALIAAPVYMLLRAKAPKTGAIFIFGVLFGLVMFVMGSGWPILLSTAGGAAAAELTARLGAYRDYAKETIGYVVLMLLISIGSYAPMLTMRDYYLELASSNGIDSGYYQKIAEVSTGPYLAAALVITVAAAILGAFLARTMFNKHFVKAGLIKEVI